MKTPYYIVYEDRLRHNLEIIRHVSREANIEIIMAFKANALWKTFPIIREYINGSTASSLNEMRLSLDYLKGTVHTYCPVYTNETFPEFLAGSSHITFNSISQYERHRETLERYNKEHPEHRVSPGLRVNPQCSIVETDIYNPCLPGSRFGATAEQIGNTLPEGIEGLHFHALCESDSYDLEKLLTAFEEQYGKAYVADSEKKQDSSKKVQDAHEAIRPTDISRTPVMIKESLSRDQFRLYQLIWKRFAASRMKPAVYETTSVKISGGKYLFTVAASKVTFDGFMSVYTQEEDEKTESNQMLPTKPMMPRKRAISRLTDTPNSSLNIGVI